MHTLKEVQNPELRDLITNSKRWALLSEGERQSHFEKILSLDEDAQESVCDFFRAENAREQAIQSTTTADQVAALQKVVEQLNEITMYWKTKARQQEKNTEKEERKAEKKELEKLLNSL